MDSIMNPVQDKTLVVVDAIRKVYPKGSGEDLLVLDNVNLTLGKNEIVSFLGRSGCGKTTLLRILAGLMPATGGEVRIAGRSVVGPSPEVAMVFQSFALFPWLTVLQNVEIGLEAQGVPPAERKRRALNKDENGRRITEKGAGPLFSGQPGKEEDFSGIVYVCRSNSTHPHIVENRDLIHKIGVTKTSVEQRMANAENDPTFLLAGVEVVATYRLYAVDRNKVEKLLHQFFDQVRMDVEIKDRFNKPVEPREWFNVPLHCIEEAVSKLIDQTIVNFKYDPSQAMLVPIK